MNRRLNILTVTGFVLDDQASGVNTMIHTLGQSLASICRSIPLENDWNSRRLQRRENGDSVHYTLRLRSPYAAGKILRGFVGWSLSFLGMMMDIRRLIRDEEIDVIHLHYGAPYQYCFRLVRMLWGIPYIITLHRGDIMSFPALAAIDKSLVRFAFKGASKVISVSQWLANQAAAALDEMPNLEVIHNGLDIEALETINDPDLESRLGFTLPEHFFLMVSNVAQYKAQDVAIRAWARVRQQWPDVPLLIVGDKRELWDECVRLIDALDCEKTIKLLGAQPRATAISLMRRATAVIIPSRSEGLPYALLEAGALGKSIVCSDIGPFTEVVVDGKTALVTPVEDDNAIANSSLRLLNDKQLRHTLGENLSKRIRSEFSAEQMAKKYLSIYLGLLRERATV
jgi:glycosyltransferase involved in cell wall biosynthesis